MMEAINAPEPSINFYEATRRDIPEGCYFNKSLTGMSIRTFNNEAEMSKIWDIRQIQREM